MRRSKLNLDLSGVLFVNAILQFEKGERYFQSLEREKDKYNKTYSEKAAEYDKSSEEFYSFRELFEAYHFWTVLCPSSSIL